MGHPAEIRAPQGCWGAPRGPRAGKGLCQQPRAGGRRRLSKG